MSFDTISKDAKSIGGSVTGLLVGLGGVGAGFMISTNESTNSAVDKMLAQVGLTNSLLQEGVILGVTGAGAALATSMYKKAKSKAVKLVFMFITTMLWVTFGIRGFKDFMSIVKGELDIFPSGSVA